MYKLTMELKDVGEYQTFPEAFKELYKRLTKMLEEGMAEQMLSAIWIERKIGAVECPLMFYDARDLADEIGLLKDGKLQEISLDPHKENLIEIAFLKSAVKKNEFIIETDAKIRQLKAVIAQSEKAETPDKIPITSGGEDF